MDWCEFLCGCLEGAQAEDLSIDDVIVRSNALSMCPATIS